MQWFQLTLDTTPPEISFGVVVQNNQSWQISFTSNEILDLSKCSAKLVTSKGEVPLTVSQNSLTGTLPLGITASSATVQFTAADAVWNSADYEYVVTLQRTGSASVQITLDTHGPEITFGGFTQNGQAVEILYSSNEPVLINDPGKPSWATITTSDNRVFDLLVTPTKLIGTLPLDVTEGLATIRFGAVDDVWNESLSVTYVTLQGAVVEHKHRGGSERIIAGPIQKRVRVRFAGSLELAREIEETFAGSVALVKQVTESTSGTVALARPAEISFDGVRLSSPRYARILEEDDLIMMV